MDFKIIIYLALGATDMFLTAAGYDDWKAEVRGELAVTRPDIPFREIDSKFLEQQFEQGCTPKDIASARIPLTELKPEPVPDLKANRRRLLSIVVLTSLLLLSAGAIVVSIYLDEFRKANEAAE